MTNCFYILWCVGRFFWKWDLQILRLRLRDSNTFRRRRRPPSLQMLCLFNPGKVAAPIPKLLPMARQNHGTKGTPISLLTNHFEVRMRQTEGYFYHYSEISLCPLSWFSHWFLLSASVASTMIVYMALLLIFCYKLLYFIKMVVLLMGNVLEEKFLTKFRDL